MTERTGSRVLELATLLCDELITDEQFAELDEILASDSEARDSYRGFLALHQRLQCEALEPEPAAVATEAIPADPEPVADGVFRAVGRAPVLEVLDEVRPGGSLHGRVRKAERRAMWSMAACVVVALLVIVLVFRPRLESRAAESWVEKDSARKLSDTDRELGNIPMGAPALPSAGDLPDVPPPPPPPAGKGASVGPVAGAGQTEESNGGFLIRDAAVNDIFQMLAKRAGKQYFHNTKVAGPEYTVRGHLNGGDPLQQMEELAFAHGLSIYQKGDTIYALNKEQLSQLPTEEHHHSFQTLRPDDIDQVKALIQPILSPTGIANYEPKTNSLIIIDSAHKVERARELLAAVDKPKGRTATGQDARNAERAKGGNSPEEGGGSKRKPAGVIALQDGSRQQGAGAVPPGRSDENGDPYQPVGSLTVTPTVSPTVLGQHSDGSAWGDVSIAGQEFAGQESDEGVLALDRLASRRGTDLSGTSTVGGVALDSLGGDPPSRESFEAEVQGFRPASAGRLIRRKEGGPSRPRPDDSLASADIQFEGQINHIGKDSASQVRPLDLRSGVDNELLADGGQAAGQGEARATISLIDRVPVITTSVNEAEVSNQVTEEVRYSVDTKDPVGDPASTREIGVTVGVTATPLPDGSIRLKMRPRSAQIVEEFIGPSGNKYSRPSESMLESIARVPEGHSVVLGGFYGQVKTKDDKVPLPGGQPVINFFFKDKEAAKERPSLLFVATPTSINDQVVLKTKILSVNSSIGGQTGVDWSSSLGESGVALESIRSLNSLFGIEKVEGLASGATAASDGPIVLSPAQTEGVLRALSSGGLVTQTSNPTLIAEVEEPETTAQVRPERRTLQEVEKRASAEPYSTFSLHVSDVSFKLAKAALARGEWPAADQIRVEEFVNAFDYGDPAPNQREKVACRTEQAAHPFLQQRNLLRVSMRTAALGRSAETPLRLTVLLDKSGSMERMDRVDSVKNAFRLLADQLNPQDQVTLIGFARTPRLLVDRLAGNRVQELIRVLDSTPVEGGTNLEQALELGIAKAKEQMLEGAQNRIILLTDGAANLGNARPADLAKLVERMRQQGIAFDACGVGADGLNDGVLESLTRKGDGRYYFLDRPEDADEGFARQIAGALRPAARNVKVQVIFNPDRVGRYKLYGFEKHRLNKEDFRNDSVDAAELAAEEAGNAIYQAEVLPEGSGEIGTVSVRFQDTESGRMIERKWTIPYEAQVPRLEDSDASLRLASSAALLGEKLKGSPIGESVELARLGKLMTSLNSDFPSDERVKELVQMANWARELGGN